MSVLVTGDDIAIQQTLTKNLATFIINSSATIKAALITRQFVPIVGPVTVLESAAGSDWANSKVIINFPEVDTATLTDVGPMFVEVQVDDGGKQTWFSKVELVKGTIDQ